MPFKKKEEIVPPVIQEAMDAAKALDNVTIEDKENVAQNTNFFTSVSGTVAPGTVSSAVSEIGDLDPSSIAALAEAVAKQQKDNQANAAMGGQDPDIYKTPGANVTVTPSKDKKAYTGPLSYEDRKLILERLNARTAMDEDYRRIDESMILDLPFIKAADYSMSTEFNPRPKDPSVRFRWVNFVNFVQGNMMRLIADGFEVASVDDVDLDKTPIHPKMIDGTQIKQYDVVLMKISVLRLMSLYRRNLEAAAFKLDGVTGGRMGEAAANQAFNDLVGHDPALRSGYNQVRAASGRDPVTFSRT